MSSIDLARARAFIATIPEGRWAAYKDVAAAAGNEHGAQAVGTWLLREGHAIERDYRVLTVDGRMPDGFRAGAADARERLRSEGVEIDDDARAAQRQRFDASNWAA